MKVEILREKRKTMVLKIVDDKTAVVKVPYKLSDKKINEFLLSKKSWLEKNAKKIKENLDFSKNFDFSRFVYLNGAEFIPVHEISIEFDKLSEEERKRKIKNFYLTMFWKLEELAKELSSKTNLKYMEIKIANSKCIWGSYNSKGQMKLNWKLLILPEDLAVYVICHELCHSVHMNHKPQFWASLGQICPNYKLLRKQLARYSFVLKCDLI